MIIPALTARQANRMHRANSRGSDTMAKSSKPVMTTTQTKTFSSPAAALQNAKQLAARGEISKGTYQKIEHKLSRTGRK